MKWSDLSPTTKRLLMVLGAVDTVLKVAALIDVVRRPAAEVRGSKAAWATGLTVLNTVGVLPALYFAKGRRAVGSSS